MEIEEAIAAKDSVKLKNVLIEYSQNGMLSINFHGLENDEQALLEICDYIINNGSSSSIEKLEESFNNAYIYYCLSGNKNIDDELIQIINIDKTIVSLYNDYLDENKKKSVAANLKASEITDIDELRELLENQIIAKCFEGILWQDIYNVLTAANERFEIDFSDYNNLTNTRKEYCMQVMAKNSDKCINAEEVKSCFYQAVDEAKKYSQPQGGGAGGSSSSGSSGSSGGNKTSSGVSIPAVGEEINDIINKEFFEAPVFNDIENVAWAKEAIIELSNRGIVNGISEGIFAPDINIKREEFVKMIVEIFELHADFKTSIFVDVDDDAWYSDYIIAASENGIINGISDYEFGIGQNISRKDMAVIIHRVLSGSQFKTSTVEFSDVENDYAKEAIYDLQSVNIINGVSSTQFAPDKYATRAESAVILYRVLKFINGDDF